MIRVVLVPKPPTTRLMNGVTRYLLGLLSYGDPGSLGIDLQILYKECRMPAREWLERFFPFGLTSNEPQQLDELVGQSLALNQAQVDVIHYPLGWLPRGWDVGSAPRIISLHGAARLTGSWHPTSGSNSGELLKNQIRLGLSKLACIITGSQWSKGEVIQAYDLQPELVEVIPYGVDLATFRPLSNRAEVLAQLKVTLGIQEPYLLYVGPCSSRKNVLRLVQAFGHLKQRHHIPHHLVLAGAQGNLFSAVKTKVTQMGLADDVIFTGAVSDETLVKLYNGASVFVFPSLYEGFGFPVVEAMACGTPVITSNCTALPETAGGAAALVDDPKDVANLMAVTWQVLEDNAYREMLRQRGLVRAQAFTWKTCAMAHFELYQQVAKRQGEKL